MIDEDIADRDHVVRDEHAGRAAWIGRPRRVDLVEPHPYLVGKRGGLERVLEALDVKALAPDRAQAVVERVEVGTPRHRVCGEARFGRGLMERTYLRVPSAPFAPSSSAMRSSWLYFALRSLRHGAPVLIWPQFVATAMSAIVESSVSPERCERIAR